MKESIEDRTTVYTCCNKAYEVFIPIFVHSILHHNDNIDIEIGVKDSSDLSEQTKRFLSFINDRYESIVKIVSVSFSDIKVGAKKYKSCPNAIRFINEPTIKNKYVYISDIDIITLQTEIQEIHVKDMAMTGLDYSNIVRRNNVNDSIIRKMSGLHFSKWDSYYPIPDFSDLCLRGILSHDEEFLYSLVKKQNKVVESNRFRPVHGIHASPNRSPEMWNIKMWENQWLDYIKSEGFKSIDEFLPTEIKDIISKINNFMNKSTEEIFTEKFENNSWGGKESRSGPGSSVSRNLKLIDLMEGFVESNNVKSMIDVGCGDFNWMKHFDFTNIHKYDGVDIVKPLIKENQKYSDSKRSFNCLDITKSSFDYFDVVLCKDVLFHLSREDGIKALDNIKKSGSRYLISTTFTGFKNKNILTGQWRPINLEAHPYSLGEPMILWPNIEDKTEGWTNKGIGIWKIN